MKVICLLACSFIYFTAHSQQLKTGNNFHLQNNPENFGQVKAPGTPVLPLNSSKASWKLISKNDIGTVWESPVDKMRCMAFNFKSKMPNTGKTLRKKSQGMSIPNPLMSNPTVPPALNDNSNAQLK